VLFYKGDIVIVNLENIKINRPKKKWDNKWDGLYPIPIVYQGVVIVDLLDYI